MQNVKGTYDYYGHEQAVRKRVQTTLQDVFELYDFDGMDSTILNELELLTSKYAGGDEILKEMYRLTDQGKREARAAIRLDDSVRESRRPESGHRAAIQALRDRKSVPRRSGQTRAAARISAMRRRCCRNRRSRGGSRADAAGGGSVQAVGYPGRIEVEQPAFSRGSAGSGRDSAGIEAHRDADARQSGENRHGRNTRESCRTKAWTPVRRRRSSRSWSGRMRRSRRSRARTASRHVPARSKQWRSKH